MRWQRVQLGELAVEIQGGHRLVTFQVEAQVLNGADAAADAIAFFARTLFAAVDGRPAPTPVTVKKSGPAKAGRRPGRGATKARTGTRPATTRGHAPTRRPEGTAVLIEAVIFDMDGVIVDSEIWWDEIRATFAAAHGRAWTAEDQAAVMGANSAAWARIMRERLDLDVPDDVIERAIVDAVVDRYRARVRPASTERSRRSAGSRPTSRSRSPRRPIAEVIDAALDATGLRDVFAVVVSSDEVAHGKPAPDVYLEAARRLGIAPAACLVVEDSINGVRAGKAAGMFVVLVPNASVPPAPGTSELADLVLDSTRGPRPGVDRSRAAGSSAGDRA